MSFGQPEYSALITLTKFMITWLGLNVAGTLMIIPASVDDLKANWPVYVIATLAALWRAYRNWKGNGGVEVLNKWLAR